MDEYSYVEFEESYKKIYASLTKDKVLQEKHCVVFLGGQPGTGKSNFINQKYNLSNYIQINGDEYRKFHPRYDEIISCDIEIMPERTQEFVNKCVERLINDLSNDGYNLIIEGTLRDSQVTINTCQNLKDKGYSTDLYIISVDAVVSWESTINRAERSKNNGEIPRYVSIDKYNYIVNNLANSVKNIESATCFDNVYVINRNNKILYPEAGAISAAFVVEEQLNLNKWNELFPILKDKFIDMKIDALQYQKRRGGR